MDLFYYEVQKYYRNRNPLFEEIFHLVNRQAIAPFFRTRLRRRRRILDVGSGSGHLARELGLYGAYFVDLVWEKMEQCRRNMGTGFFVQADLSHLPFGEGFFDGVICSNVLHYTGIAGLREILRVTKEGGQIFIAFLENSSFTRTAVRMGISLGLFPSMLEQARLIDLADLAQLGVKITDSATVGFFPPLFEARREISRQGLVVFELER
jgi:SAM-dependent methyltransferase